MLTWFITRLREPSTYAGLSSLALAIGLTETEWLTISAAIAAVVGVVAMLVGEKTPA